MNAQQLKNAILQEAIEGRLVPQAPNDEPASALLARTRKEKERLVKEGKLKKKDLEVKPISEDEIPFEIPESWEWVRLSSLSSTIHYGYTASAAPTGNSKLLRITDIQNDKVDWKSVPYCTIKEKELESYQLKNRDILIARTGGTIGKTYIVRQLEEVAVFASYLIRVIPLDEVNEEFLKLFMMTPCYWKQLTDASSGTGQPNVNGQSLSNLILPIPPKEEQSRILSKYEELLPKVEEYGKAQDALNKLNAELPERLKKSILQEAIEGRLAPQNPNDEPASVLLAKIRKEKEQLVKAGKLKKKDLIETPISEDEIPFEIPDSWKWCNLFDCVDILYGYPFDSTAFNENSLGFPLIRIRDIIPSSTKTYTTEKAEERYVIKRGDMLVGMDGNFNVCFWKSDDAYLNQRVCKITAKESILNQKYLYYYLPYELEEIFKTVSYVTVKHLSDKHFRTMRIPLPPLAEQHRIVEKLEQLLGEIDKLKK